MIPAAPAIHYHVTVMCGESPCAPGPILAQTFGGGGSPTPVPPSFTTIRLELNPRPPVMPAVVWRSNNVAIVVTRADNPLVSVTRLPGDTAATPAPDTLQTLLVPGPLTAHAIGGSRGVTTVEADIGAPVNERVSIPVYTNGGNSAIPPEFAARNLRTQVAALAPSASPSPFRAAIDYADPASSTYGPTRMLFTEVPWGNTALPQAFGSVRVSVSPQPYTQPDVTWSAEGDSLTVAQSMGSLALRGTRPGTSTLFAKVGGPVNQRVSIPVVTYRTLTLPCNHGVRYTTSQTLELTNTLEQSDLFLPCGGPLQIPSGAVMLSNGDEPTRSVAKGAIRGPQFPELDPGYWQSAFTLIDMRQYDDFVEPCFVPESPGVVRVDSTCTAMPARTILFKTRDGRKYVKWLIQTGNGLNLLAGPYQVL